MIAEKFFIGKIVKMFKGNILFTMIAIVIAFILGYCSQFIFQKKDAPLEEACEAVIEETTGYQIDFTPEPDQK